MLSVGGPVTIYPTGGGSKQPGSNWYKPNGAPDPATIPVASGTNALAAGSAAVASGTYCIAFGTSAQAIGNGTVALGAGAYTNVSIGNTALGGTDGSTAAGAVCGVSASVCIGTSYGGSYSYAADGGVTIGAQAGGSESTCIAIGFLANYAYVTGNAGDVVVGARAYGSYYGTAVGLRAYSYSWSQAIGNRAVATAWSVRLGASTDTTNYQASGTCSVGIGYNVATTHSGARLIGQNYASLNKNEIVFPVGDETSPLTVKATAGHRPRYVETTDATPTAMTAIASALNSSVMFTGYVTAYQTGGAAGTVGDSAGWKIEGQIVNVAGAYTLVGYTAGVATAPNYNVAAAAAWAVNLGAVAGGLQISVTGEANKSIKWAANIDFVCNG